jgi:hypothetical protein
MDLDTRVNRELQVLGHLLAVIPGQRAAQLLGQLEDSGGQCRAHALGGEPLRQREQPHIAAAAFHQGPHRAGPPAKHQIAFPMPGHRPGRPTRGVAQLPTSLGQPLATFVVVERLQDAGGGRPQPGRGRAGELGQGAAVGAAEVVPRDHRAGALLHPGTPELSRAATGPGEQQGGGIAAGREPAADRLDHLGARGISCN